MNKLPIEKRIQILSMLVEGSPMRSTSRVCDVSINTVARYLDLAGKACWLYHDEHVRGIKGKRDVADSGLFDRRQHLTAPRARVSALSLPDLAVGPSPW